MPIHTHYHHKPKCLGFRLTTKPLIQYYHAKEQRGREAGAVDGGVEAAVKEQHAREAQNNDSKVDGGVETAASRAVFHIFSCEWVMCMVQAQIFSFSKP